MDLLFSAIEESAQKNNSIWFEIDYFRRTCVNGSAHRTHASVVAVLS